MEKKKFVFKEQESEYDWKESDEEWIKKFEHVRRPSSKCKD